MMRDTQLGLFLWLPGHTQPDWGARPLGSDVTVLTNVHGSFSWNLLEPENCQLPEARHPDVSLGHPTVTSTGQDRG